MPIARMWCQAVELPLFLAPNLPSFVPRILPQTALEDSLFSCLSACACVLICVRLFVAPQTAACQAPLSMEFSKQGILEWVAISYSRGSSPPRDQTQVSCGFCIGRVLYHCATLELINSKKMGHRWWQPLYNIYVHQNTMLCPLNIYTFCQLYLSKAVVGAGTAGSKSHNEDKL